jgi:hypothetical protein
MKKLALFSLAAMTAFAMPGAGTAQDVEAGVGQGVNAEGVIELTPDYLANLIASSAASSSHIDQVANAESVTVINVGPLLPGAPQDAGGGITLEAAIEAGAPGLEDLRPQLEANEFVVAALEAEGLTAADVVALSVEAVGSLTVYVNTGTEQAVAVTPQACGNVAADQPLAPAADQQASAGMDLQAGVDITADQAVGPEAGQQANAGVDLQAGADITADQAVGLTAEQATTMLNQFSTAPTTSADIMAFADASAITIVDVGAWLGDDADASASAALSAAIDASITNLASVHSSLSSNAAIVAALEAEGFTTEDVVGLNADADGGLTIFVTSA